MHDLCDAWVATHDTGDATQNVWTLCRGCVVLNEHADNGCHHLYCMSDGTFAVGVVLRTERLRSVEKADKNVIEMLEKNHAPLLTLNANEMRLYGGKPTSFRAPDLGITTVRVKDDLLWVLFCILTDEPQTFYWRALTDPSVSWNNSDASDLNRTMIDFIHDKERKEEANLETGTPATPVVAMNVDHTVPPRKRVFLGYEASDRAFFKRRK